MRKTEAEKKLERDREVLRTLSGEEKRHAFHGFLFKVRSGFTVYAEELAEWRRLLPKAIADEYDRLGNGELPRSMTLGRVLSYRESSSSSQSIAMDLGQRVAGGETRGPDPRPVETPRRRRIDEPFSPGQKSEKKNRARSSRDSGNLTSAPVDDAKV